MQRLAAEKATTTMKAGKRSAGSRKYVLHVDFDSFFCAVSLKKHPEFVERPTVVAHSDGPGSEIASCNYPARTFGVKNGMWMKRALEMCPDLKVVPYDFPAYEDASRLFYEAILDVGGIVQSVSIDEALVDVTSIVLAAASSTGHGIEEGSIWREQEKVADVAQSLRDRIRASTGCEVSVGIGGNILQAKVALRKAKPAGQFHLKPEMVLDVIGELQVDDLPGVAYSISGKLEEIGVKLVKDIRDVSRERLSQILGPKTSEKLVGYARGIDKTEVGEQTARKSVSAEVNWGIRFLSQEEAEEFVMNLCKELEKRLLNEQVKGSQLTMKIMRRSFDAPLDPAKHLGHGKCDVFNKSATFGVSTNDAERIGKEAVAILRSYKFRAGDLRGLGVQMTKLEPLRSAMPDGSQKKLAFDSWKGPSPARAPLKTEAITESDVAKDSSRRLSKQDMSDPITDDPLTPRKPKMHPSRTLSKTAEKDQASTTPLNVSGTQFILPSQVDANTLAELPKDIRSRLMGQASRASTRSASPAPKSRSESPMPADVLPSQVDAEVFNALPEDMKAEVLASYGRKPQQVTLQQSPRKNQAMQQKKPTTPTKRGGLRGMFGKGQRQRDAQSGLVQTNFLAAKPVVEAQPENNIEELDPAFLAELPEDVRKEVIADHRRQRLAQRSGLDAPAPRSHHPDAHSVLVSGQTTIQFPATPSKVAFAQSGVTSTQEIKDMLDAWHTETQSQGPHNGDVEVLAKYLARVVQEERDIEKARKIVKWLDVLVEHDGRNGRGRSAWRQAVAQVRHSVQGAVRERGMAPLKF
jgi:DNA repair protein REV1